MRSAFDVCKDKLDQLFLYTKTRPTPKQDLVDGISSALGRCVAYESISSPAVKSLMAAGMTLFPHPKHIHIPPGGVAYAYHADEGNSYGCVLVTNSNEAGRRNICTIAVMEDARDSALQIVWSTENTERVSLKLSYCLQFKPQVALLLFDTRNPELNPTELKVLEQGVIAGNESFRIGMWAIQHRQGVDIRPNGDRRFLVIKSSANATGTK